MPRGGARPGAGRHPGVRNRKTTEALKAIESGGITPLDYLLKLMRDEEQPPPVRLDAAKSAAPYVHPRLNSTELTTEIRHVSEITDDKLVDIATGGGDRVAETPKSSLNS